MRGSSRLAPNALLNLHIVTRPIIVTGQSPICDRGFDWHVSKIFRNSREARHPSPLSNKNLATHRHPTQPLFDGKIPDARSFDVRLEPRQIALINVKILQLP
jgi:hypothetical protein